MIKGTAALLLFAGQVLPTWCLTIDQFGLFSYLNSILVVLSVVAVWGVDRFSLKNIAISRTDGKSPEGKPSELAASDTPDVSQLVSSGSAVVLLNSVLLGAGLLCWLPYSLGGDYTFVVGGIVASILLFRSMAMLSAAVTKGADRVVLSEFVFSLTRPAIFVCLCGIAYLTFEQVSLNYVLASFAISFLISAIVCRISNSYLVPQSKNMCDLASVSGLYRNAFFFLLVSVGLPLMANINTIQLGNVCEKSEVALYAIAAKLVSLVLLGLVSANLLIAPKLSPMFSRDDISGMKKMIRNNNLVVASITCIPVMAIVFFAENILAVFGPEYEAAALLLRVLMIGQVVSVFCGPVVLTSTMTGLQKTAATLVLASCFVNWLACLFLIPYYSAMGAVVASVCANALLNISLAVMVYKRIGLNVTMVNLIK